MPLATCDEPFDELREKGTKRTVLGRHPVPTERYNKN